MKKRSFKEKCISVYNVQVKMIFDSVLAQSTI